MKRTKRRPFLIFWILGVVALVVSTAGAISALHSRQGTEPGKPEVVAAAAGMTASGFVDVDSGVTGLYPAQPGRVVEILVHENDKVKAGAPLLRMDERLAKQQLQIAKADLEAAKAQLSQARSLPEEHRLKLSQQQDAIDAMKSDLDGARAILKRKQELAKKEQISPLEAEAAAKLVDKLEAGVRAEEKKLQELKLLDPQLQIARAQADVDAKQGQFDKAQLGLDECVLKAPADGEVLQVLVGPGASFGLQMTQPAIQFCPDKPRIVRAEIEQEFARRIRPGLKVEIEDDGGGKVKWHGKVLRLSNWYTQRRSTQPETIRIGSSDVRTLECIIELDKGAVPFRLGQRVRATISQEP